MCPLPGALQGPAGPSRFVALNHSSSSAQKDGLGLNAQHPRGWGTWQSSRDPENAIWGCPGSGLLPRELPSHGTAARLRRPARRPMASGTLGAPLLPSYQRSQVSLSSPSYLCLRSSTLPRPTRPAGEGARVTVSSEWPQERSLSVLTHHLRVPSPWFPSAGRPHR